MTVTAPTGARRVDELRLLEAEAVHIIREVVAELERPVLLFSAGKDSIVLLRLAERPFDHFRCHSRRACRHYARLSRGNTKTATEALRQFDDTGRRPGAYNREMTAQFHGFRLLPAQGCHPWFYGQAASPSAKTATPSAIAHRVAVAVHWYLPLAR